MHKRSLIIEGTALDTLVSSLHLEEVDVVAPRSATNVTRLFRKAYRMLREKPDGLVTDLTVHTLRILLACAESRSPNYPVALRVAMKHVNANIHRAITVAEIARVAGLSVRHCTRMFGLHLACSPLEFCIRQRMALAQNLLANTNQTVKSIAASLGYDNQLYFSALFRRRLGASPGAYRRKLLSGKTY